MAMNSERQRISPARARPIPDVEIRLKREGNELTRDEALRLQININDILRGAKAEPDDVRNAMGAINWGDLLCTDIELRRSLIGKGETIVATIEEASPDAAGLRAYVQAKLGRDDVKIETEW
jgi:hypothetical protein